MIKKGGVHNRICIGVGSSFSQKNGWIGVLEGFI
jgi:hypothetical protein